MSAGDRALVPVEQRDVVFYGDEITAVRTNDGQVYVPVRPLCDLLEVDWSAQRRRINRDPVLVQEQATCVVVTATQGQPDQRRDMLCLPLDFVSGFLFGINANRVKPELRERLVRYQRECYRALAEAFREGRLTAEPALDTLLRADTPAAQAYRMALAVAQLARQQLLLESQLGRHEQRIEQLEARIGTEERHVTEAEASQISQAVKAIAMVLGKRTGRNEYGGVYGELYRRFGITSYKLLPAGRFGEAMAFLTDWHQRLVGDAPF